MLNQLDQFVKKNGYECGIDKILHTATILPSVFDMDYAGWIVVLKNGEIKSLITVNGIVCWWKAEQIKDLIDKTSKSLNSLKKALKLLEKQNCQHTTIQHL